MDRAWSPSDAEAAVAHYTATYPGCGRDLALRVYSSRLLGRQADLVLHGGGNTSVKTEMRDDLGQPLEVLCVKGSGWDLKSIEPPGFPALRLSSLQALRVREQLSDEQMVNAARIRMLDASAPNPSVETLLHAFLPHKFIDHSHADAVLATVDQPEAEAMSREIHGDKLALVPYIMPGFALAKLAAEVYEQHPACEGLLLLQHGLFTFGETAQQSYERHIAAVTRCEEFLARGRRRAITAVSVPANYREWAPVLRGALGPTPYVFAVRNAPAIRAFVDDPELKSVATRGPVTPDHVIRTKQKPLIVDTSCPPSRERLDQSVAAYRRTYKDYVAAMQAARGVQKTPLDPDPRVLLLPGIGLVGVGRTPKAARVAADLYEHTISVITQAEAVGRYQALPDLDIFDMEYWSLEQAKLGKKALPEFAGKVVYISGAARGIGAATARAFARRGASLFLVDRDGDALHKVASELHAGWAVVDMCDRQAVAESVEQTVELFGGLDGVISNAGTAPQSPIDSCPEEVFRHSLDINLVSHQNLAAASMRVFKAQGLGGFLLFNVSKAALNPGKGFGPYAVAKAGLLALTKQYALEGGPHNVRASAVNADRVRTGLLPPEVVATRAKARGLDADAYFRSNLLAREVLADDVAEAFVFLARAPSTTGAVITVDGGNVAAAVR